MKLVTILVLCAVAVGCGYGSHSMTPPTPGTAPTITQLSPMMVTANSGAFNLTVTGTKFAAGAFVDFGANNKMTTMVMSSTQAIASIPNSAIMNSGTVQVTITNPGTAGGIYGGGTSPAPSAAVPFTVQ